MFILNMVVKRMHWVYCRDWDWRGRRVCFDFDIALFLTMHLKMFSHGCPWFQVFIVQVRWSDGTKVPIYRQYSDFHQLHVSCICKIITVYLYLVKD